MDEGTQQEREIRAARNQAMFRAINEKLAEMADAVSSATRSFSIACECADTSCVDILEVAAADYEAVRAEPRRFFVLPGHVYPDVERVVDETAAFVVVEKIASAADVAESLA
ncbi:MAG TPA: hypothetical protein VG106_05895 [Vicinamibacterales bacterium]|nr:hypothetical protein [Vicinamibacterales bacterium]